jgi:hypothetical protein
VGDQSELPFDMFEEKLQPRRLHKKSQPLEKMDRVIEDIRELTLRSAQEVVSKGELNRRDHSIAAGKKKKKHQ